MPGRPRRRNLVAGPGRVKRRPPVFRCIATAEADDETWLDAACLQRGTTKNRQDRNRPSRTRQHLQPWPGRRPRASHRVPGDSVQAMPFDRTARWLTLLACLCPAIAVAVAYAGSPDISISGEEQNVVFAIQSLLDGHALYRDPSHLPFVVNQYTPIYYELCFAVCRWLGLHAPDIRGIYLVGRLLSAAATFGCCLVMVGILSRYSSLDRVTRFALAFVVPVTLGPWAFVARPDPFYVLLVAASLLASLRYAETFRRDMLALSALLLLAAFYTRQTALFLFPLPLAIGFAHRGWRAWVPRDICLAIYAAGTVFLTPQMWRNFTVGLGNGTDPSYALWEIFVPTMLYHLPLLLAVALALQRASLAADWRLRAVAIATLWYFAVGASLSIKYGSSGNYYDEFLVGCVLILGIAPALASAAIGRREQATAIVLLALVVAGQALSLFHDRPSLESAMAPRAKFYAAARAFAEAPELRDRRIMIFDASEMLFFPDRAVFVPPEVLGDSAASGHFDLTPVVQAIRDRQVCFAVADAGLSQQLLSGQPLPDDVDRSIEAIGPLVTGYFHVVRQIGPRTLLVANACRGPSGNSR